MKRLFTVLMLGLALVACDDKDDDSIGTFEPIGACSFKGTLSVTPNEGSPFGAFEAPEIEFILTENEGLEQGSEIDYLNLSMPQIKFVEQMPVWIALEVIGIPIREVNPSNECHFGLQETIPYYMGAPYDPKGDGQYTIYNLEGYYENTTGKLYVDFDCYTMHVHYEGAWVATSAHFDEVE
ncbi:MAG: hypothetical protein IJX56_00035 [Alistipes sp.]|nr:hypothetical protein [Alistipes sp.]